MRAWLVVLVCGAFGGGCDTAARQAPPARDQGSSSEISERSQEPPEEPADPRGQPAELQVPPQAPCGDAEACYDKALAAQRAGEPDKAVEAFESACGLGLGIACARLGEMLRDGRGISPNGRRARALFEQGCALGSSIACDAMGH